ncbi:MAG: TIGR04283 family arsenosugar biosynthesis glycosyltransferase [Vicinamibacterales bacterium]
MVATSTGWDAEQAITVVIPVLNDAAALASVLPALPTADRTVEIIVVDGGDASDRALDALRERHSGVRWMQAATGRGTQMNHGARHAHGRWLVFLHSDTRLGVGWIDVLRRLDEQTRIVGGSFRFALDSPAHWARWIEWGVSIRVRLFDLAYGDQALFVRRTVFEELGGYRELPLMEDVDFIRRLRRHGRLEHASVPALTSARRWERDGWFLRTVDNAMLVTLFLAGYPPESLARHYHRRARR